MGRELERRPEGVTAEFVNSQVLQSGGGGVALARPWPRREHIGSEREGAISRLNFREIIFVTAGAGEAAASHGRRRAGVTEGERAKAFGGVRRPRVARPGRAPPRRRGAARVVAAALRSFACHCSPGFSCSSPSCNLELSRAW